MDQEQTYRVEHIFRPLTAKQVEDYEQQMIHLEQQFLKDLERYKAAEKAKAVKTPLKRSRLSVEFEEELEVPQKAEQGLSVEFEKLKLEELF
uniref:Uncharacterized protein n=1 Tax=Marseillevirus LCMAC101 TaxID=2506602 RepID=A0A481YSY4_9VIRU|nr:MAG: hypothetical protein LCMAC101_07840 [Marseillevirus LCMAC101]